MKISAMPGWAWICLVLVILALFFAVCMNGYAYITLTLLFAAFLIVITGTAPVGIKRWVWGITAVGFAYFCFVESLVISNARGDREPGRDYVIVLGAQVRGTEPSLALLHRLQKTKEYLETYPQSVAVVSGGQGSGEEITEGECMKAWLVEKGIAPNRVLTETKATSTMENLSFSRELIDAAGGNSTDIAIVSSPYHLYRAKSMAGIIGMNPVGVACVHGYPVFSVGMYIREAFGVTHLWIFGN